MWSKAKRFVVMIREQFIRYAAIGLGVNAVGYVAYLLLTWLVMGSLSAMTIVFSAGTLLSFIANRNLTFRHVGGHMGALLRFVACYGLLYLINYAALWFFAKRMGVAHQVVQGCIIMVLPLLAFAMQKYWVFPAVAPNGAPLAARAER